ncbi:MAG: acyltransferase [Prevotellaceae bacterium]|nr:acyltransferase [Candidatus Colivivens equi]
MGIFRNIIALIRGNVQCLCLKLCNGSRLCYHPFLRVMKDVDIRLDAQSKLTIGKGALIDPRCVISSSDGGNLNIGDWVGVNCNSMIMCHDSITIGCNTIMGPGVLIYDHDHDFNSVEGVKRNQYKSSPVTIGRNCWIGAGSIILRGSSLGNNCLVAAGSIVKGDYPDGSVIIQKREEFIRHKI